MQDLLPLFSADDLFFLGVLANLAQIDNYTHNYGDFTNRDLMNKIISMEKQILEKQDIILEKLEKILEKERGILND